MTKRLSFKVKSLPGRPPLVALAFAVVLSLSACGGGGGGSVGLNPSVLGNPVSADLRSASMNEPVPGSVTQGSRGSGVTADRVQRTATGLSIESVGELPPVTQPLPDFSGAQVFRSERAVAVAVSGFSGQDASLAPRYDDTDPLLFGIWAYGAGGGSVVWGTFADGLTAAKTPSAYLTSTITGTATYQGKTFGAYENTSSDSAMDSDLFVADVGLSARFGSGNVNGVVYNFNLEGASSMEIILSDARIDRSTPGGFFKGETSDGSGSLTGEWGGQFFGAGAEHIGGTWGASTPDGSSAAGAFSAERQPPVE